MRTPPEERRVAEIRKAVRKSSCKLCARAASNRATDMLAHNRERQLWMAHLRAVDLDLAEGTSETKIIRTLAHGAWRSAFLADEFAL